MGLEARRATLVVQGRALSTVAALLLISFSPSVAWFASQQYARLVTRAAPLVSHTSPPLPPVSAPLVGAYAPQVAAYEAVLDRLQVSPPRRARLLQDYFTLYRRARMLFGPSQAGAMLRLIATDSANQQAALGRRSMYSSPEATLAGAERWLDFASAVLRDMNWADWEQLSAQMRAGSPVPMAPQVVLHHAQWIRRAAYATHLPPAALAAVVDTEQAGDSLAYGLSGLLRDFTDTVALRSTQLYGRSGMTGELSKTVGLAQMSWEDALGQQRRLRSLGAHLGVPFPQDEAGARALLARPYANLLLTASRMVGYLAAAGKEAGVGADHGDAWVYFLGPGWHNNPQLASSGQTWPYAWNAFFKACIYQRLLE